MPSLPAGSRRKSPFDCRHEAFDGVRLCDGVNRQAMLARGLRGYRTDAYHLRSTLHGSQRPHESAHRGRARERDGVDIASSQRVASVLRQRTREPRSVCVHPYGMPALRRERILETFGRDVGPRAQHTLVTSRKRTRERRSRERLRHQVRVPTGPSPERLGRPVADRRDSSANVTRRQVLAKHIDRARARDRHPVEPTICQMAQSTRERDRSDGNDLDRRSDDHGGAAPLQLANEFCRLLLRASHDDRPASEWLRRPARRHGRT